VEALLLSNTSNFGHLAYEHVARDLHEIVRGDQVVLIPYALDESDTYIDHTIAQMSMLGVNVINARNWYLERKTILEADVVMVSGGNTFRLLSALYELNLVERLRERVLSGKTRYLGASAGANIAGPTIKTTNDMPIVYPPSFNALSLVPYQINPHYIDIDPTSMHMGESRDQRIKEYFEANDGSVVALYEGSWIRIDGGLTRVHGPFRIFRQGYKSDVIRNFLG